MAGRIGTPRAGDASGADGCVADAAAQRHALTRRAGGGLTPCRSSCRWLCWRVHLLRNGARIRVKAMCVTLFVAKGARKVELIASRRVGKAQSKHTGRASWCSLGLTCAWAGSWDCLS